ncbi:MAG: hypothetical protein U1D35_00490 [Paracoccaceae bacterium]|nr:hypothetical protein [Paracoccaceae bacterium]
MSADDRNLALIRAQDAARIGDALRQAQKISATLDAMQSATFDLLSTLKQALQQGVTAPPPLASPAAEHRRQHRTGVPSRITADPEVEAFIRHIIETMPYAAVVARVAETFPPERHISHSSLQRWWRKHGLPREPQSSIISRS